jgi:hypothetical protein
VIDQKMRVRSVRVTHFNDLAQTYTVTSALRLDEGSGLQ